MAVFHFEIDRQRGDGSIVATGARSLTRAPDRCSLVDSCFA